jgi:hypothetical protein
MNLKPALLASIAVDVSIVRRQHSLLGCEGGFGIVSLYIVNRLTNEAAKRTRPYKKLTMNRE